MDIKSQVQLAIRSNTCRPELMTVEYSPSLMPLTSHTAWNDPASSLFRQGRMRRHLYISVFECWRWQIDTISMEGNFNYTDSWD